MTDGEQDADYRDEELSVLRSSMGATFACLEFMLEAVKEMDEVHLSKELLLGLQEGLKECSDGLWKSAIIQKKREGRRRQLRPS